VSTRAPTAQAALDALVCAFENLTPQTLPRLLACYAEGARFRDPFNEVRGRAAIAAVFAHMFATLDSPRFRVTARYLAAVENGAGNGGENRSAAAVLRWEFRFSSARLGGDQCIEGLSELRFDAAGRVVAHLDYWDPAAGIYEKVTGLGWLLKALRRRLAAPRVRQ
jgi:steroid delta-isomerase